MQFHEINVLIYWATAVFVPYPVICESSSSLSNQTASCDLKRDRNKETHSIIKTACKKCATFMTEHPPPTPSFLKAPLEESNVPFKPLKLQHHPCYTRVPPPRWTIPVLSCTWLYGMLIVSVVNPISPLYLIIDALSHLYSFLPYPYNIKYLYNLPHLTLFCAFLQEDIILFIIRVLWALWSPEDTSVPSSILLM